MFDLLHHANDLLHVDYCTCIRTCKVELTFVTHIALFYITV